MMIPGRCVVAVVAGCCAAACAGRAPERPPARFPGAGGIGTILFLGADLPDPGTPLGGHYTGISFDVQQQSYRMTETARAGWSRAARMRGETIIHGHGFQVRAVGMPTSDVEELDEVRFGIGGRVTELTLRTYAPATRAEVRAEVAWELIDLPRGAVVFGRTVETQARSARPEEAVSDALDYALMALLADSAFHRALRTPLPELEAFAAGAVAVTPVRGQPIAIAETDLNPPLDSGAVSRVAAGIVALRGADGGGGTAMVLTRNGLAITSTRAVRQPRRLRARFPSGVVRSVRVLRSHSALEVALIQVACPDVCVSVDWDPERPRDVNIPVIAVRAPEADRAQPSVVRGLLGGRWGLAHGVTLATQHDEPATGGEPVALAQNGRVVAMVSSRTGRQHALLLGEIFRALRIIPPETDSR